jgi:hypothetical protein
MRRDKTASDAPIRNKYEEDDAKGIVPDTIQCLVIKDNHDIHERNKSINGHEDGSFNQSDSLTIDIIYSVAGHIGQMKNSILECYKVGAELFQW